MRGFVVFRVVLPLLLSVSGASGLGAQSQPVDRPAGPAFIGVRILKTADSGSLSYSVELPGCDGCQLALDHIGSGQNAREIFFHATVPGGIRSPVDVHVSLDEARVRDVVIGRTDPKFWDGQNYKRRASFTRTADGITFAVPMSDSEPRPNRFDQVDVTQNYTFVETPGVMIRVMHADIGLRGGAYASGPWPKREAQAALNLEFASREAIVALGLDHIRALGADLIELMGFDTNYPTVGPLEAHEDWPPHWHMIVHWLSEPLFRKASHLYIGPDGLLTQIDSPVITSDSHAPVASDPLQSHWYAREEIDYTRSETGALIYGQKVTKEGYFELISEKGVCHFVPSGHGFDGGVNLSCTGRRPIRRLQVDDDMRLGRIRVYYDGHIHGEYPFDIDTGRLLNSSMSGVH